LRRFVLHHKKISPFLPSLLASRNEIDIPDQVLESLSKDGSRRKKRKSKDSASSTSIIKEMTLKRSSAEEGRLAAEFQEVMDKLRSKLNHFDLRIRDGSYTVTNWVEESQGNKATVGGAASGPGEEAESVPPQPRLAKQETKTVVSASIIGRCIVSIVRLWKHGTLRKKREKKVIMEGVNLYFETGKMYLVLGGPGSGKVRTEQCRLLDNVEYTLFLVRLTFFVIDQQSTLLKLAANNLLSGKGIVQEGSVSVAGISPGKGIYWNKLVGYIDQIDRLHPFLTVKGKDVYGSTTGG